MQRLTLSANVLQDEAMWDAAGWRSALPCAGSMGGPLADLGGHAPALHTIVLWGISIWRRVARPASAAGWRPACPCASSMGYMTQRPTFWSASGTFLPPFTCTQSLCAPATLPWWRQCSAERCSCHALPQAGEQGNRAWSAEQHSMLVAGQHSRPAMTLHAWSSLQSHWLHTAVVTCCNVTCCNFLCCAEAACRGWVMHSHDCALGAFSVIAVQDGAHWQGNAPEWAAPKPAAGQR